MSLAFSVNCFRYAIDYLHDILYTLPNIANPESCQAECQRVYQCGYFAYGPSNMTCYLKSYSGNWGPTTATMDRIVGPKFCTGELQISTIFNSKKESSKATSRVGLLKKKEQTGK